MFKIQGKLLAAVLMLSVSGFASAKQNDIDKVNSKVKSKVEKPSDVERYQKQKQHKDKYSKKNKDKYQDKNAKYKEKSKDKYAKDRQQKDKYQKPNAQKADYKNTGSKKGNDTAKKAIKEEYKDDVASGGARVQGKKPWWKFWGD